jgi:hypothetical protein
MMMSVEHSEECLARETEVLGENLPQFRFVLSTQPEWVSKLKERPNVQNNKY